MLILLVYAMQVYATIGLSMDMKQEFFINDVVSFNYTISSDTYDNITYLERVECLNAPVAALDIKTASIVPQSPLHYEYVYFKVSDNIAPQECTAYLSILAPIKKVIYKNFTITTNPVFSFDVILDKKVFLKGDNITIDYTSGTKNPLITATLAYPDKSVVKISLPYSFKADKIGTYELQVTASKEGYKTVSLTKQFAVITEDANIKQEFSRTDNLKQNNSISKNTDNGLNLIPWIFIGVFIMSVLGLLWYIVYLRGRK